MSTVEYRTLVICPGVVKLDHTVGSFIAFQETSTVISTVATSVCIPTRRVLCSPPCQYSLPFLCTHRLLHLTILSEKFLFHRQRPLLGGPTTGQCTETGACSALNGISTSHHVLSGDQELLQRRGRKIVRGREIRNDHSKTV